MKDKIGMTFSGVITNVAPFGIFVRLDQWSIDGLVYVGNLGADYFTVTDPVSIVGSATGISYVVGDRVDVIIDSIDPDSGRIQLLLTSEYRDLTYKKKKARSVPLSMNINLFEDRDEDSRQVEMLRKRINKLGPFDRAIILLWLENMSYEEIGQVVGISTKNVSVRLFRIKEQLKNMSND